MRTSSQVLSTGNCPLASYYVCETTSYVLLQHCSHPERLLREYSRLGVLRIRHSPGPGSHRYLVDCIYEPIHLRLAPVHPCEAYV